MSMAANQPSQLSYSIHKPKPRSASWRSQGIKSIMKKLYLQSRQPKGQRSNDWLQWYSRSLSVWKDSKYWVRNNSAPRYRTECSAAFCRLSQKMRVHELIRIWHYVKEIQIQVQPKLVILDFLYCSWKPDMFVIHYLNGLQKWGPQLCLWRWKSPCTIGTH